MKCSALAHRPLSSARKSFLIVTFAGLCSACSPLSVDEFLKPEPLSESMESQQDDPIVKTLTGKPVSYVQEKLGLPNQRKDLPTGAMIWTYFDNEKGLDESQCKVALSIRNGTVEQVSISTKASSLFSAVSSKCERIRKILS